MVGFFSSLVAAGEAVAAVHPERRHPVGAGTAGPALPAAPSSDWKHIGVGGGRRGDPAGPGRRPRSGRGRRGRRRCWTASRRPARPGRPARRTPDEADALFAARRLAYPALERLGPVLTEDVCVPIAAVPAMLGRIEVIAAQARRPDREHRARRRREPAPTVDHRRPVTKPPGVRAQAAFAEILVEALAAGGTVTGEHGVGLPKRTGLVAELSPAVADMHERCGRRSTPTGSSTPARSSLTDAGLGAELNALCSAEVTLVRKGDTKRPWVAVEDVAQLVAAVALEDDPPRLVEFGGPDPLTRNEAIAVAERLTGRTFKRQRIPTPGGEAGQPPARPAQRRTCLDLRWRGVPGPGRRRLDRRAAPRARHQAAVGDPVARAAGDGLFGPLVGSVIDGGATGGA